MSNNTNIRVRITKAGSTLYWYVNLVGVELEVSLSAELYHTTKPGVFAHKYRVAFGPYAGNTIEMDDVEVIGGTKKIFFTKPIILFSLMNAEGLFFKSGSFDNIRWTDDINEAKVYSKAAPARSWATKFAKVFPDKSVPQILEITASSGLVVDETERVAKARKGIEKAKVSREERNAQYRLEAAQKDLARVKKNLDAINGGTHK